MLTPLYNLSLHRTAWLLLAKTALALEITALYFQYVMALEPCVMCIYQRIAVFGIAFAGIIGALAPRLALLRLGAILAWLVSAVWGAKIAYQHVTMQQEVNPFSFLSCEARPDLPDWLPLDSWLPAIFEARGSCSDIDWEFLSLSMPQWMLLIFIAYSLTALLVLSSQFRSEKD